MDDFLTPVSTVSLQRSTEPRAITVVEEIASSSPKIQNVAIQSPETVSRALKEQPDTDTLVKILDYLVNDNKDDFSIVIPSPVQARIVNTLVNTTVPDYWRVFKESGTKRKLLVACFKTTSGIGAILSRIRLLTADARQKKPAHQTRDVVAQIEDLFDILELSLADSQISSQIWKDISMHALNPNLKKLIWKEYILQVTSGKIVSLVAEAEDLLKEKQSSRKGSWLADGNEFASWLGLNLANLMRENIANDESIPPITEICNKALNLGYLDRIARPIIAMIVDNESANFFKRYMSEMKAFEQRKYFDMLTTFVANEHLGAIDDVKDDVPLAASTVISSAAALIHSFDKDNGVLKDHLISELVRPKTLVVNSLAARRSLIAAAAEDEEKLHNLLEKAIKLFGDSFYIKHTPVLQQEVLGQTLVIASGYVHRSQPLFLTMMAKSTYHVQGMSNRIGATSQRARFLGIAVGTALSKMVDKPDLQLKFDLEGDEAVEAKWYQRLTQIHDKIGNIKDLRPTDQKPTQARLGKAPTRASTKSYQKPAITEIKGPRIVEILDDDTDEDDDLVPYDKPDSDPEDDTDDPTMINRNKPTAPVYIRDLLKGLRDSEDYDRHAMALSTAASLIRRKANFGSEVTDHIEELASVLTNLNDNFDIPEFDEQRQQALIAILLAKPAFMGQYFVRSFFSGDFSLSQRIAMLTTLGVGARDLAGLKDAATDALVPPKPSFPSKQLPPHLHKMYASQQLESNANPVSRITSNLTQHLLSPMAAEAADTLTGPNILKVRTFSSRMQVEQRRSKPVPNALAQIVADNFFFPLTGRWWIATRSRQAESIYASQHLLPQFLHTLALLLNAAGPNTLALPQMTREFWELLLSVRGIAGGDKGVLSALLFAFLMLLETNQDKERLVNEQGKELLETQEWVRLVFANLGAGSEEDEKIRALAAGVVVRCQEVVDKYQRRLAGSMMDY